MAENEKSAGHSNHGNQRWAKKAERYYARIEFPHESDGRADQSGTKLPEGDWGWQRLDSLEHVDNLYDLGFWENMRKVIWPYR